MLLCVNEQILLVKEVYSLGRKYSKEVQSLFMEKFGEERLPDGHCVSALTKTFKQTYCMQD